MQGSKNSKERRRAVATRVLLSYAIIMLAFTLVAGWSVLAQRNSAREARLMRDGYLPLALSLRDLVANQDTWNTQLNHITAARNPADKRVWFETALSIGRPKKFGEVRARIARAFQVAGDASTVRVGADLLGEATAIEEYLQRDAELVRKLFEALDQRGFERAERLRDKLVTRGFQGKKRLSLLEQRVQQNVDALLNEARARERLGIRLLIGLVALTLMIGVAMALYARRVLKPLSAVTARAEAVANGDLTPHPVLASNDEIGELALTFEAMVAAIARANEQLLTTERLATIGKMAAHVTHEIRNPLSAIALNLELLEEELSPDNAEGRALLRAIGSEVDRLTSLSSQYLSMAKRQDLRFEEEDVGEVVREAFEFMKGDLKRHGVNAALEVQDALPKAFVDEAQIKQAVLNLTRNAREAMEKGGTILIRVQAADNGVEISVEDEGPGIDEETRAQLFEPFFTTKGHGTGLGLAITRHIVEAHHGSIGCEPRPGGGTRFWFVLPCEAPLREPAERASAPDSVRLDAGE